jgi:hypothetical protein
LPTSKAGGWWWESGRLWRGRKTWKWHKVGF